MTTKDNAPRYEAVVRGEVIPGIEARAILGFLSIDLLRRAVPDGVEFATIMWFTDLDAVKAFVGDDYELAHVPERAREVLTRFDDPYSDVRREPDFDNLWFGPVPGSPRIIHTPGHTPGSAAVHVPAFDALFIGDTMTTRNVLTGVTGPKPAPFTLDPEQAVSSLDRVEKLDATWVLPGHGPAWDGGVPEAVRLIREAAAQSGK